MHLIQLISPRQVKFCCDGCFPQYLKPLSTTTPSLITVLFLIYQLLHFLIQVMLQISRLVSYESVLSLQATTELLEVQVFGL